VLSNPANVMVTSPTTAYPRRMTASTSGLLDERTTMLHQDVLAAIAEQIMAEATRTDSGCLLNRGRTRWLGGDFSVKRVLHEARNGPLAYRMMLVRTCNTEGCVEPEHHVARSRKEFGQWLGTGSSWRHTVSA
jgi:hypothetical protein